MTHSARTLADLRAARAALELARRTLARVDDALARAALTLSDEGSAAPSSAVPTGVQSPLEALPEALAEHRRAHRPGRPPRLACDAELRAFVESRLPRMTFHQIEAEVAAHFEPSRRIRKSAIAAWSLRTRGRR